MSREQVVEVQPEWASKWPSEYRYQKRNRKARRWWHLNSRYGVTPERYEVLLQKQGRVCAICESSPEPENPLQVDHCHRSGSVRGLLCGRCNKGLGIFAHEPLLLEMAVAYLDAAASEESGHVA